MAHLRQKFGTLVYRGLGMAPCHHGPVAIGDKVMHLQREADLARDVLHHIQVRCCVPLASGVLTEKEYPGWIRAGARSNRNRKYDAVTRDPLARRFRQDQAALQDGKSSLRGPSVRVRPPQSPDPSGAGSVRL